MGKTKIIGIKLGVIILISLIIFESCLIFFKKYPNSFDFTIFIVFMFYAWQNKILILKDKAIKIYILFYKIKEIDLFTIKKVESYTANRGVIYAKVLSFYIGDKDNVVFTKLTKKDIFNFKEYLNSKNIPFSDEQD